MSYGSVDSDDSMSDVIWTPPENSGLSTTTLSSSLGSSDASDLQLDTGLWRPLKRMAEDLEPVNPCREFISQLFANFLVTLPANFNYFLERISSNKILLNDFLPTSTTTHEFCDICEALLKHNQARHFSIDALIKTCKVLIQFSSPPNPGALATVILEFYQETFGTPMDMDVKAQTIQPQLQAIVPVKSWDDAWETEYEDRALKNFLLYLDNLWQQRRSHWEYGKGTSHSFCATIVQSSCAGKSRLVYSYAIYVSNVELKVVLGPMLSPLF